MSRYIKIRVPGGSSYLQPMSDLLNAIDAEFDGWVPGDEWEIILSPVEMTEEEYEALPEFTGH